MEPLAWMALAIVLLLVGGGLRLGRRSTPGPTTGATVPPQVSSEQHTEIDALLAQGEPVKAIKRLREFTGLGLVDAKRLIDTWQPLAGSVAGPIALANPAAELSPTAGAEIDRLVAEGRLVVAIKAYREATGVGLKEAKQIIERWR